MIGRSDRARTGLGQGCGGVSKIIWGSCVHASPRTAGHPAQSRRFPSPRQIPRDDSSFCSAVPAIQGLMSNGAFYRERVGEEEEEEEEEKEEEEVTKLYSAV